MSAPAKRPAEQQAAERPGSRPRLPAAAAAGGSKAEAAAAAAAAAVAAAAENLLDELYGSDEQPAQPAQLAPAPEREAAEQPGSHAGPGSRGAAVAAAAAAAPSDEPAEPGPGPGSSSAAPDQQQPQQQQPPAAGGSSGRAPPTQVQAPELPADLAVFSNAVLLVDKPPGWTSFDACNAIKKAVGRLGIKKVGHAGTLDPSATGLLIICTGSGTKSIDAYMGAPKEYSGTLKLGEGTASLDAETEVEERLAWEHITDEQLREAAAKLTGDIQQVPPMYSALHHKGQRLHELARAGVTVEREARPVTITRFDVRRDEADRQLVHFYVGCSKGTYIRTLAHDLATSLGSTGHLTALRREAIGEARVDRAWQVEPLLDQLFAAIRARPQLAAAPGRGSRGGSNSRGRRPRGGGGRGGGGGGAAASDAPGA